MGYDFAFIDFISYIMSFFDSLSKVLPHHHSFFRLSILLLPIPVHLKTHQLFVFPLITAAPANFVSPFIEITFCKRKLDPDRIFPSNLASDTGGKILVVLFLLSAIPDKRNAGISPFCLTPVPPSLDPC